MRYFLTVIFCSVLLSAKEMENKNNCNPNFYLQALEEVYKSSITISDFLDLIQKRKGSVLYPKTVSASQSFSLQASNDLADPRVYLENDCIILTITLSEDSIEYAIKKQKPDDSIRKGILLGHLGPFPKKELESKITETIHKINPMNGKSNLRCTSCHVDVAHKEATNSYLGLKKIDYKKENIQAVVSPFFYKPTDKPEGETYCASDLQLIQDCLCKDNLAGNLQRVKKCDFFFSKISDNKNFKANDAVLIEKRCEKIQLVNNFLVQLKGKLNPFYKPIKCLFVN